MFDPYHKWLGIPKDQRPPTFYQLLGLVAEEQDPEVIEEAALRQTSHLRSYQAGQYSKECAKLLNEVSLARLTLLNPAKRQAYDAKLAGSTIKKSSEQAGVNTAIQATVTAPPTTPEEPPPGAFADLGDLGTTPAPTGSRTRLDGIEKPRKPKPWLLIGAGSGAALLVLMVCIFAMGGSKAKDQAGAKPSSKQGSVLPTPSKPEPKPTFLADLMELKAVVGFDTFGKGSFGPAMARENKSPWVAFKDKPYPKALVMHPSSNGTAHVTYALGKKYKTLSGTAPVRLR